MTPLDLLILALFAWYTAYVLVKTSGPFKVFERLRTLTRSFGVLECMYCTILWTAVIGYRLIFGFPMPTIAIVHIGAIAGLGMLGHRYTGGDML